MTTKSIQFTSVCRYLKTFFPRADLSSFMLDLQFNSYRSLIPFLSLGTIYNWAAVKTQCF
jgi:hypothetical protein